MAARKENVLSGAPQRTTSYAYDSHFPGLVAEVDRPATSGGANLRKTLAAYDAATSDVLSRTGYVQDLWEDMYALTRAAADLESPVQYAAFEVLNPYSSPPAEMSWRERVLKVHPPSVDDVRWTFAGYDIADYYLLSALMNCGYTEEDRRRAASWIPHLNKNHLFESSDDALEFRREADERVPEHAPFFVFGIWLLPGSGRSGEGREMTSGWKAASSEGKR